MSQTKIIIISGLPVTGKSTLAEALAKKLSIPVFSVDPIESAILKSGVPKSFETGMAAYLVAERLAEEQLKLKQSIIIDAVSPVKWAHDLWQTLAKKTDSQLIIIECILKESIHKTRVKSRIRNFYGFSEVTWDDVIKTKSEYLPWEESHLIIDTANDSSSNLKQVLEYLKLV